MISNLSITRTQNNYSQSHHIQGNTLLANADIVFVADFFTDLEIQHKNTVLVDQIWRDHRVVIEHLPLGQVREAKSHFNNFKYIYGWDLPDAETTVRECKAKEEILNNLLPIVEEAFTQTHWRDLIESNPVWTNFLKLVPAKRTKAKQAVESLLNFAYLQVSFRKALEDLLVKVKRDICNEMSNVYENTFQARLVCLQRAIEEALNSKQKLIVCLSADFVVRKPNFSGNQFEISHFLTFLKTRKYVIISAKNSSLKMEDQPSLWGTTFNHVHPTSSTANIPSTSQSPQTKKEGITKTSVVPSTIPYIWEREEHKNKTSIQFKPQLHASSNDFPKEIVVEKNGKYQES